MNNYVDPIEKLSQACVEYKSAMMAMTSPNKSRQMIFLAAEKKYRKALKAAISSLKDDLKYVNDCHWLAQIKDNESSCSDEVVGDE